MVNARVRNAQAPWGSLSAELYYEHNYRNLIAEDQEIIRQVSPFFVQAFAHRDRAELAIDVGSGSNLYPALLMLPWANHIQLIDYSPRNVSWLRRELLDQERPWAWRPFWLELEEWEGYSQISEPRKQLRDTCFSDPEHDGVRQFSVFDLPAATWQLGTMFFVAEGITEDFAEFRQAIARFVGALQSGSPFAATFMAGSRGYEVDGIWFPALPITCEDVRECLEKLGASELSVQMTETPPHVREGYQGMILATGISGGR